jgi:hypothetical protein
MTITFRNKFGDRMAFAAYHLPRNPLMILMLGGGFLLLTFGGVLPAARQDVGHGIVVKTIVFIIAELFLAFVMISLLALLILLGMVSRKNKTFYAQKTVTISDDGLFGESEYGKSEIRWKMVQKLARTRNYIFIYLSAEGAWVIPRRAFGNAAERDAFYDICTRNVDLSKTAARAHAPAGNQ